MGTRRAVGEFGIEIDLSSFDEGNFYRRTFLATFVKRTTSAASDAVNVLCEGKEMQTRLGSKKKRLQSFSGIATHLKQRQMNN